MKISEKAIYILAGLFFLLIPTGILFISKSLTAEKKVDLTINGDKYRVILADSENKRTKGLSGRESLKNDEGMLFVFEKDDVHTFWMKDMNFDLDILWIKDDDILDITENIPKPENSQSNFPFYKPKYSVNKVLELNAGTVEKKSISIGDKIVY